MHLDHKGHGVRRSTTSLDEAVVIGLSGELDAGQPNTSDVLQRAVERGASRLIIDMIDVSFIDSSVARALLVAERATAAAGGWLRLVFTHHVISRVIEICGLTSTLPQYPTLDAARRGAPRSGGRGIPGVEGGGPSR